MEASAQNQIESSTDTKAMTSKWMKFGIPVLVLIVVLGLMLIVYLVYRASNSSNINRVQPTSFMGSTSYEIKKYSISKEGIVWSIAVSNVFQTNQINSEKLEILDENTKLTITPSFNFAFSFSGNSEIDSLGSTINFMGGKELFRLKSDSSKFIYFDLQNVGCIEVRDQEKNIFVKDETCTTRSITSLNLSLVCDSALSSKCDELVDSINLDVQGVKLNLPEGVLEYENVEPYIRFRYPTDRVVKTYSSLSEQPDISIFPAQVIQNGKPAEIAIYTGGASSPEEWLQSKKSSDSTYSVINSRKEVLNGKEYLVLDVDIMGIPAKQYVRSINSELVLVLSEVNPGVYSDQDLALQKIVTSLVLDNTSFIK